MVSEVYRRKWLRTSVDVSHIVFMNLLRCVCQSVKCAGHPSSSSFVLWANFDYSFISAVGGFIVL